MSAFAKKDVAKRGIFGLGYGYGSLGYGASGTGNLGYSSLGYGAHGYSALGYSGLGHASYISSAPVAAAHYVQPHTHTHSVETKVVQQPYPVVKTVAVPQVT